MIYHKLTAQNSIKENISSSWRLYLAYRGDNENNVSGWSDKFWELAHTAGENTVTIRWGKIGSYGQTMACNLTQGLGKAADKLKKGYREDKNRSNWQEVATPTPVAAAPSPSIADALLAKFKDQGFPYNSISRVVDNGFEVVCLDDEGDMVLTLTHKGATDILVSR